MFNKYIKYKNKYINLKKYMVDNFTGGTICDFTDWKEIKNAGQHNCGIFVNKKNPDIIMKCALEKDEKNEDVIEINKKTQLFPKIYDHCTYEKKFYCIMEKLDNDITFVFFHVLPDMVIHEMKLDDKKDFIKKIFFIKQPQNSYSTDDEKKEILDEINSKCTLTFDEYDIFIKKLIEKWKKFHFIIIPKIAEMLLTLISLGYFFNDFKFDNLGYKLSKDKLNDNAFFVDLFDQYLCIYFLDWTSGLEKITGEEVQYYTNKVTIELNTKFKWMVNGQYSLEDMNIPYGKRHYDINFGKNIYEDIVEYKQDLNKILNTKYIYTI